MCCTVRAPFELQSAVRVRCPSTLYRHDTPLSRNCPGQSSASRSPSWPIARRSPVTLARAKLSPLQARLSTVPRGFQKLAVPFYIPLAAARALVPPRMRWVPYRFDCSAALPAQSDLPCARNGAAWYAEARCPARSRAGCADVLVNGGARSLLSVQAGTSSSSPRTRVKTWPHAHILLLSTVHALPRAREVANERKKLTPRPSPPRSHRVRQQSTRAPIQLTSSSDIMGD